jgi:uncharacterized protein YndB with AHSA1/START domain
MDGFARAIADTAEGRILATVDVPAPTERVFDALTSSDITTWWIRPGVFDTREWTGDVRIGGSWRSSGIGARGPYELTGDFLEIERPRRLVHSWRVQGAPGETTVTYVLEPIEDGTRIVLRHDGFSLAGACQNTAIGWETSFARLREMLTPR